MPAVVVAWIFNQEVSGNFAMCLAKLIQYDAATQGFVQPANGGGLIAFSTGPRIAEARSQVVDQFAREPDFADAEWLLMLDSDMTFDPDLVERLMAVADSERVPVLGGLCFAGGRTQAPYPTIYEEVQDDQGWVGIRPVRDYPRDTLVRVGGTGAACLLVHRSVYAAMAQPYPAGFGTLADGKTGNPYPWFIEGLTGPRGEPFGEDIAFCRRLRHMNIPIHVHTGIRLGHMKVFELTEEHFLRTLSAPQSAAEPTPAPELPESARKAAEDRSGADTRREAARAAMRSAVVRDEPVESSREIREPVDA